MDSKPLGIINSGASLEGGQGGQLTRGPRDDLDAQLPDIFGKSVPIGNFKKW